MDRALQVLWRGVAGAALLVAALPGEAPATVLAPDYRFAPHSTISVFEDSASAGWQAVSRSVTGGQYPLFNGDPFDPADPTPFVELLTETQLGFFIPNFVDPLPFKLMRISLECGTIDCGGITGQDIQIDPVDGQDPITDISFLGGGPFSNSLNGVTGSAFYDFQILPNPDWELVVFNPQQLSTGEVIRITVDTVSDVPIPATLPLLGLALAGFGIAARRRRS